jgi:hypothetical protein
MLCAMGGPLKDAACSRADVHGAQVDALADALVKIGGVSVEEQAKMAQTGKEMVFAEVRRSNTPAAHTCSLSTMTWCVMGLVRVRRWQHDKLAQFEKILEYIKAKAKGAL